MLDIARMEAIPAGANPFNYDLFNMGTRIGKNIMIMHGNHKTERCDYIIIVDMETGERYRMSFSAAGQKQSLPERIMNGLT